MTTIAYRDGILAADSRETSGDDDSGQLCAPCQKLYRVGKFVVALQGDTTAGLAWLKWFQSEYADEPMAAILKPMPDFMVGRFTDREADFTAVVLTPNKRLFIYDEWGFPQEIKAPYYAVGSGAKVAYGAMHAGASAFAAVLAACEHDPYTAGPVNTSENI